MWLLCALCIRHYACVHQRTSECSLFVCVQLLRGGTWFQIWPVSGEQHYERSDVWYVQVDVWSLWRKVLQGTFCVCCIFIKRKNWGFFVLLFNQVGFECLLLIVFHLICCSIFTHINAWVYFIFILCCFVSRRTTLFPTLNLRTFFSYIVMVALVSANGFKWGKWLECWDGSWLSITLYTNILTQICVNAVLQVMWRFWRPNLGCRVQNWRPNRRTCGRPGSAHTWWGTDSFIAAK